MTSVNYNASATAALRTLQATNQQLDSVQNRISTGYRIGEAKDNAAYWAISTTLKSDNKALSTVKDALGLGAATVDTAYEGLNAAKDVLDEIKAKLTAATQDGVDRNVIQAEIAELQKQLKSIAESSTFSGENWLSVNSAANGFSAEKSVVASFNRDNTGNVTVGTIKVDTANVKLYDANGKTGILDGAVELTGVSVGGSNSTLGATAGGLVGTTAAAGRNTAEASTAYLATKTALVFDNIADKITMQVTVDGGSAKTVDIRLGTVQTALNNSANSVTIATKEDLQKVLTQAFKDAGVTGVTVSVGSDGLIKYTSDKTGSTSDVIVATAVGTDNVAGATGTLNAAGQFTATDFETGAGTDEFQAAKAEMNAFVGPVQFTSATDKIKFSLALNGAATPTDYVITKADVDAALGTTDGKIATAGDFQAVLAAKLTSAAVTVGALSTGKITFTSQDTTSASAVAVSLVSTEGFTGSAGTTASISVADIDISTAKMTARGADTGAEIRDTITAYIDVVSAAISKVTTAASNLGAVSSRIELQQTFVNKLMDTIDNGVSGLIDADMSEESTKLQALQTKQQLGVQALSIANSSAQNILRLFQ